MGGSEKTHRKEGPCIDPGVGRELEVSERRGCSKNRHQHREEDDETESWGSNRPPDVGSISVGSLEKCIAHFFARYQLRQAKRAMATIFFPYWKQTSPLRAGRMTSLSL